jgi:hypothetical protein
VSTPDALHAVAALQRCIQRRDYAQAACLTTRPEVLDGIARLAAYAAEQRALADEAMREAAAARLAEAERARVQAVIGPLLNEVIGVLAEAMGVPRGAVCVTCKRSLGHRRNCPYCGTRDARVPGWPLNRTRPVDRLIAPVSGEQAARHRAELDAAARRAA